MIGRRQAVRHLSACRLRVVISATLVAMLATLIAGYSVVAAAPQSCADIHTSNSSLSDGTYTIFPNGQAFTVYCYNMASSPADYLTLPVTWGGENFGNFAVGGASSGTNVTSTFAKVRLNPATLQAGTDDFTFATSTGEAVGAGNDWRAVPWGWAESCNGFYDQSGRGNVDLRYTPFAVNDAWAPWGYLAAGSASDRYGDRKVIDTTGGGWCGNEAPQNWPPLQLAFVTTAPPVPSKPATNWSFYVTFNDAVNNYNVARQLGANQGSSDVTNNTNSLVILDFGAQLSDGVQVQTKNGINLAYSDVEYIAEAFADGYWSQAGNSGHYLSLFVGTNNSNDPGNLVNAQGADLWANSVANVSNYVSSQSYTRIGIGGANDIEPAWTISPSPGGTEAWVSEFIARWGWFVDFGSADGCPVNSYLTNGACSNNWTQDDVWWVSRGSTDSIFSIPLLWDQDLTNQWTMISRYGATVHNRSLVFYAPMDENDLVPSEFTSDQAWQSLWQDINQYNETAEQTIWYSEQIHNECDAQNNCPGLGP